MCIRIVVFLCFIFISPQAHTQAGWHLTKEKSGIKIYTKKTESSSFKSIKVEGVFEGSWQQLFNILMDVNAQKQWVYRTKKSYVIKKISRNEVLYYTETSLPWPVNNRDAVVRMKITYDSIRKVGSVLSLNEPNLVPVKSGLVRIQHYKAIWQVRSLEKNKIDVTYYLEVEPGGGLPAAVVNMFISSGPYETFSKLKELLKK
jgi:hypothetical protein